MHLRRSDGVERPLGAAQQGDRQDGSQINPQR